MTALSDYCTLIRSWTDIEDLSDAVITQWVRDAEERINNELRVTEMVAREYATLDDNCIALPADWNEFLYVRVKGGRPFDFISNHDYWELQDLPQVSPQPGQPSGEVYPWAGKKQLYTLIGNTLFVWPPVDPEAHVNVEIAYFRKLAPLDFSADPVFVTYPTIYRNCTLAAGAPYLVEDERLQTWATLATAAIEKANVAAKKARFSGSPIAPRIRGFG